MSHYRAIIKTTLGAITVELYPDQAPITVANFLDYVKSGRYDRTSLFRIVTPSNLADQSRAPIRVIHGGPRPGSAENLPMIPLETTGETGLRHRDGTISMGRDGLDTAEGDFFICLGEHAACDEGGARHPDGQGFAAFGQVIDGLDVCRHIYSLAGPDEYLEPEREIEILSAHLLREPATT